MQLKAEYHKLKRKNGTKFGRKEENKMAQPVSSPQFTLNNTDYKSLFRGLLITLAGAALTWVAANLGKVDFGQYTAFIVPVLALLVNSGLKFVDGAKK
jgi:hypothetical protein